MILFFGPPGSGKSVQGELLVKNNGWEWVSTGQLFRDSNDPEVRARLKTGELIDDELTNKVLETALGDIGSKVIVLDGYPRNIDQAEWLMNKLPSFGQKIDCVIAFSVSKDEVVRRLSGRGRAEDTREVIERRLEIYNEKTDPVLQYFDNQGVIVEKVDGEGLVEDVHKRIQASIESCIQK